MKKKVPNPIAPSSDDGAVRSPAPGSPYAYGESVQVDWDDPEWPHEGTYHGPATFRSMVTKDTVGLSYLLPVPHALVSGKVCGANACFPLSSIRSLKDSTPVSAPVSNV